MPSTAANGLLWRRLRRVCTSWSLILVGVCAVSFGVVLAHPQRASAQTVGEKIVAESSKWNGTTYCFGGGNTVGPTHGSGDYKGEAPDCTAPSTIGFDCTGLTLYAVYQATGKVLSHDATQATNAVGQGGQRIYHQSELQPGDLVYFGSSFSNVSHVAVYAGGGEIWDANTAFWIYPDGVHERSLAAEEDGLTFVGAVRFNGSTGGGESSEQLRPAVVANSSSWMNVFLRSAGGELVNQFWTLATGWHYQTLPGGADVAGDPTVVARSSDAMDVVFRTPSGSLAEGYWSAETGWVNQGLPGGADVAGNPAGVANSSAWMNAFFLNGSGTLAEDYWTVEGGWVNETLGSTFPTGFTSGDAATFVAGSPGEFLVSSQGSPMATLSETGTLPVGVSFVDSHNDIATLSGTPAAGTGGAYPLSLESTNGIGAPSIQAFTLTVNEAPAISSPGVASFVVGESGTFAVTTNAGYPSPTVSESGTLPNGVTFSDEGKGSATLTGLPEPGTAGIYPITITAANGTAPDAEQRFVITVQPIAITTSALPAGSVYTATNKAVYSASLAAIGGKPPFKWSLVSGSSLPPGLKLSSRGVISGKAKVSGHYEFVVQVVDTKTKTKPPTQNTATKALSIVIA